MMGHECKSSLRSRPAYRRLLLAVMLAAAAWGNSYAGTDAGIMNFLGPPYDAEDAVAGLTNDDVAGAELIVWWNQLEPVEGVYDWSMIDDFLAAWDHPDKLPVIRVSTAHEILNRTPLWLFDDYGVRRIFKGKWSSFETGLDSYVLLNGAARTNTPAHVVSRDWSVYGENTGSGLLPDSQRLDCAIKDWLAEGQPIFHASNIEAINLCSAS